MMRSGQGTSRHDFDVIYYPCLQDSVGTPFGAYVHGNDDTAGAVRSLGTVRTGLSWRPAAEPVSVLGTPSSQDHDNVRELAATVGAYALGLVG